MKKLKILLILLITSSVLISCEKPKPFTDVYYTSTSRKEYIPQTPKLEDMQIEDTSNFKVEEQEVTSPTNGNVAVKTKVPGKSTRSFLFDVKDEKEMTRIIEASQGAKDTVIFIKNKEVLDKEENKEVKEYYEDVILKESAIKDFNIIEIDAKALGTPYIYAPANLKLVEYAKDKDLAYADAKGLFITTTYETKETVKNENKKDAKEPDTLSKDVKYTLTIESLSKLSTSLDAKVETKKLSDFDVTIYDVKGIEAVKEYKQSEILGAGGLTANIFDFTKENKDKKLKQEQLDVLLNNVNAYIIKIQKEDKVISLKDFYSN